MRATFGSVAALVFVAALTTPAAAAWEPIWHRTPAFSVEAVAIDDAGHVYATGFTGSPWAMVLARFDADGARRWTRTWRSHHRFYEQAIAYDVAVSPDGRDVYVVGATVNDAGEARLARMWAYRANGSLRWTRPLDEVGWGVVEALPDGAIVGGGPVIVRLDRRGAERWARSFLRVRGDVCDVMTDLAAGGGGLFVVGYLDRTPTCNDSEGGPILEDADVVIQRRALTGRLRWSTVRTDARRANDLATSVDVAGRSVFVAGEGARRGWLQRLTFGGRTVWTRAWTTERPVEVSGAPWDAVYVLNDHEDGGTWLTLRRFTPAGELTQAPGVDLATDEVGSALSTGAGRMLIVAARVFGETSDLWRMPV
jgi:hypothetical protein